MSEPTAAGEDHGTGLREAVVPTVLGLLLPGLGHFLLARRGRALLFAFLVFLSIAIGCALDGTLYEPVPGRPLTFLATLGAMGMGIPYFALGLFGYRGDLTAPGFEYGTAFLLGAGLMNLLLVLDVWDIGRGRKD